MKINDTNIARSAIQRFNLIGKVGKNLGREASCFRSIHSRLAAVLSIAVASTLLSFPAAADTTETQKLLASDGTSLDNFGIVAVSGNTMVIGAPGFENTDSSGAAYVFSRSINGWIEEAKLTAIDGQPGDIFGGAVAISGDTVFIGAPGNFSSSETLGAVYVFNSSDAGWTEVAKLTASDGAQRDRFGSSIVVSGDNVVIGAPLDDDLGDKSGSAYIFQGSGSNWAEIAKLTASDGDKFDRFGVPMAASGDTLVIGSANNEAAYVFTRSVSGWIEDAKLTSTNGAPPDDDYVCVDDNILARCSGPRTPSIGFGRAVAVSNNTVIVGAYQDNELGDNSGSVFVFERSDTGWTEDAKLTASDGNIEQYFGASVSISGDTVVIGAPGDPFTSSLSGAAYVFKRSDTGWTEDAKLTASDGEPDDNFGAPVAISGNTLAIGALGNDDLGENSGAAYVFALPSADTDADGINDEFDNCPAVFNTDQADLDDDGAGDVCDDDDDNDGFNDSVDNCPLVSNPSQADHDGDNIGDSCDTDVDGDGVTTVDDSCPLTDAGDPVDANGCAILQRCPEDEFSNRGQLRRCVARTARAFVREGIITRAQRREFMADFRRSQRPHRNPGRGWWQNGW